MPRVRTLSGIIAATALASVGLPPAIVTAAVSAANDADLRITPRFSPNGDGLLDVAVIRYTRTAPGRTTLRFTSRGRTVRTVRLGWQEAGRFTYRWGGRNDAGKRVRQGRVLVALDRGPRPDVGGETWIDRTFRPEALAPVDFAKASAEPRVFPRSTVVRDALPLRFVLPEDTQKAWLVVTRPDGRRFRARNLAASPRWGTVRWEARHRGRPLPAGHYEVAVGGVDTVGNRGVGFGVGVRVTNGRLRWKRVTETVSPQATQKYVCSWLMPSPGCHDYVQCGTIEPSTRFRDGLSYRSRECEGGVAEAVGLHYVAVPESAGLRGGHAINVSFSGSPTAEGSSDVGTLSVTGNLDPAREAVVTGSSSASTGWFEDPRMGWGNQVHDEEVVPGAMWWFSTQGANAVDVEHFTVSMRYLVIDR